MNIVDEDELTSVKIRSWKSEYGSGSSFSRIKLDSFSPMSKRVMKSAHAFARVQLATLDAFPTDRTAFVQNCLKTYSNLSSTSPDISQHIQGAVENEELYAAYVSPLIFLTSFILKSTTLSCGKQLLK